MVENKDNPRVRDTDQPMNDKREGIVRDAVMWSGQVVSYVKDIGNGDAGYDANRRQVLITLADGSEKVVPESEILREKKNQPQTNTELDRPGTAPRKA